MPQAGIHGLIGLFMRGKLSIKREWMLLGIVLGNILPDMDAIAVAYATLSGGDSHGLHRTWSHSILFMIISVLVFYAIAKVWKSPRIGNLGLGLGLGMLVHSLIDLFIWFRGVELFWPFYPEINFWSAYTPPEWWFKKLEFSLEFGLLALLFYVMGRIASSQGTDLDYLPKLKMWMMVELALFIIFSVLVFAWSGVFIVFGAAYIFSLSLSLVIIIKMRETIEASLDLRD